MRFLGGLLILKIIFFLLKISLNFSRNFELVFPCSGFRKLIAFVIFLSLSLKVFVRFIKFVNIDLPHSDSEVIVLKSVVLTFIRNWEERDIVVLLRVPMSLHDNRLVDAFDSFELERNFVSFILFIFWLLLIIYL
jgi:hypothetical protein